MKYTYRDYEREAQIRRLADRVWADRSGTTPPNQRQTIKVIPPVEHIGGEWSPAQHARKS